MIVTNNASTENQTTKPIITRERLMASTVSVDDYSC